MLQIRKSPTSPSTTLQTRLSPSDYTPSVISSPLLPDLGSLAAPAPSPTPPGVSFLSAARVPGLSPLPLSSSVFPLPCPLPRISSLPPWSRSTTCDRLVVSSLLPDPRATLPTRLALRSTASPLSLLCKLGSSVRDCLYSLAFCWKVEIGAKRCTSDGRSPIGRPMALSVYNNRKWRIEPRGSF